MLIWRVFIIVVIVQIAGCTQPFSIRVLDRATEQPIAGANVTYTHIHKPYFIAGSIMEEKLTTNKDGYVLLADREGGIEIEVVGYEALRLAGVYGDNMWIWLERRNGIK